MHTEEYREIPYNYTSADDAQIVKLFMGYDVWERLESLRSQRISGRSARLLMRFMGDLFVLRRNPFIYQELADSVFRRHYFFKTVKADLEYLTNKGRDNEDVRFIVKKCGEETKKLKRELNSVSFKRMKIKRTLSPIIGKENILFDPFALISHATDATDWRLYLPIAILRPYDEKQIAPLLKAVEKLGLHVIPRGAGTGLTGGSVPVSENCVMINTEKLNRIRGIHTKSFTDESGRIVEMPVLEVEAGVVTESAMNYASSKGFVFATDPTSAWASTIGGNIAENAGGKTAVLWGTAIDNIVSYKMAMPGGKFWEVTRTDHKVRKILHDDTVNFDIRDESGGLVTNIQLRGDEIRKPGLWKDITNKALGGLPGVQKEGTDGIITSAYFILYTAYEHKATACLEFYGNDMDEASKVIVAISQSFINKGEEALQALEHFDEEYIKAINYKIKSPDMIKSPKAVLLVDIVAHNEEQLERGRLKLAELLAPYSNTFVAFSKDKQESERFWADRKKLGAISARTNAFKLNEDIVLPLHALADFANFVDHYNFEEEKHNQRTAIRRICNFIESHIPIEDAELYASKVPHAKICCDDSYASYEKISNEDIKHAMPISTLIENLNDTFMGYSGVFEKILEISDAERKRLIVLATHMHAGDGNVHVNIPVFSNDREMMARASMAADKVMEKAVDLGGVVSGEHGIGITKMKYLDRSRVVDLDEYRKRVDPKGTMNPGKLSDPDVPDQVFTPSFNLLGLEAGILKYNSLENLSGMIAKCIRCSKCKPSCCTYYPAANMFYHPRNKNLAIASIIEALMYEAQRWHSGKFPMLRYLEEIADHCTLCHKCKAPCPVDIDTAEVSLLEREILVSLKYKRTAPQTWLTLRYLKSRSRYFNAIFRKIVLQGGGFIQRKTSEILSKVRYDWIKNLKPMLLFKSPVPKSSNDTLRSILPKITHHQALVIEPESDTDRTVFYFPGCGSERLFSQVSKAAIYILLKSGVRVVLPPSYLCCGFPVKANAREMQHSQVTLRDTIILSHIREMMQDVKFDAVVVSCGTCKEELENIKVPELFDCNLMDVSEYAISSGLEISCSEMRFYHAPCHDSMGGKATKLLEQKCGFNMKSTSHCCSEAGTMALSRPDITSRMLDKKRVSINEALEKNEIHQGVILTNCPSCLQGLGRNQSSGMAPRHIAEELALKSGGYDWEKELVRMLDKHEKVNF
ncbi:DUF3683 domain-containing protein [Desulforegula conservatrix]|uniref:DUF3683 domain-containing protein n=1 Tax=Desulforegula conservatrix TaxID=153026 RepID=UPI0004104958|nr:DUF3683 domain-containing protein [Desulforegula conservatrix]